MVKITFIEFNGSRHEVIAELGQSVNVTSQSRLSCQVSMTPELDGIVVHLPESQT